MVSIKEGSEAPDVQKNWHKALVEAQRQWIAYRGTECELTGFKWYEGTCRSGAILDCAQGLTEARTMALKLHAGPR